MVVLLMMPAAKSSAPQEFRRAIRGIASAWDEAKEKGRRLPGALVLVS
jgi:hypothetical protein